MVLHAASSIMQQATEVNSLLAGLGNVLDSLEVWYICHEASPESLPQFLQPLSSIQILRIDKPDVPEAILQALVHMQGSRNIDLCLFASDGLSQELCTRLAFRLGGGSSLLVENCCLVGGTLEVTRPVYGNNLTGSFHLAKKPWCLSGAKKALNSVPLVQLDPALVELVTPESMTVHWQKAWAMHTEEVGSALAEAEIVLVVGHGVKSQENVAKLQGVADALGAEIGASRPVVMSAWAGMDSLVGMSGHVLSPRICIAAGVSGASVFKGGIAGSDFLVAINSDRQAAIFEIADVGIVDDLFAVLFSLEKIVRKTKESKMPAGEYPDRR